MPTVLQSLAEAVRSAARYNPDIEAPPACILWPDGDRDWVRALPRLLDELPELLVYGDYDPENRQGPAIWLRCVIANRIEGIRLPKDATPIIYLPGISRQQLRDVENCPDELAPLVELQFRGTYWSQVSSRDWTVLAYLKSKQGGLGLDVAQDEGSKQAMKAALRALLDEEVVYLATQRLDQHFFNTLITGGDFTGELLQWLDQGEDFRNVRSPEEWEAFVALCESQLGFNPEQDGPIVAASTLVSRDGPWKAVWDRFCEAPSRYPHVPQRIRSVEPPKDNLLWYADREGTFEAWPQWNDEQEGLLRNALLDLANKPPHEAKAQLLELEAQHSRRRHTVWADIGEAPLALAMEPLSQLARATENRLNAGTIGDVVAGYTRVGWQADDAALRAIAAVHRQQDIEAVTAAIRAVYLPWADDAAHYLQQITEAHGYPGDTVTQAHEDSPVPGECILFVDGLRFDTAKRLVVMLQRRGLAVGEEIVWAAFPTITETAKAAVSPIRRLIRGNDASVDYVPQVGATGQTLTPYHFKRLLREAGWQVPEGNDLGDPAGSAWFEFGNLDEAGHVQGLRLARQLDELLHEISEKVVALLSAGWKTVQIRTDHGWLLMPGGLPKAELSSALTETKWRRFAALKSGASSGVRLVPWYWNPDRYVAIADGIRSFHLGMEYTHGGLSLQECLTLHLSVTTSTGSLPATTVSISNVTWQGLRCRVVLDGAYGGVQLDIRTQPGDAGSSVVATKRPIRDDGTGSVVVTDDDLIGNEAFLVLVAEDGSLVAQRKTTIGGDAS